MVTSRPDTPPLHRTELISRHLTAQPSAPSLPHPQGAAAILQFITFSTQDAGQLPAPSFTHLIRKITPPDPEQSPEAEHNLHPGNTPSALL
ncbi:hypothetical protein GDO81_018132 [Engystomops pustulosus]|uniref:Uncharacterized protein n=1 Tax=Engystomops pustulosus TaxID=76066 RepID=A0AAV7A4V4_ENGPU|nr:hypothetical protein GDO81_018132 [Engystomops pustulosus]